MSESVQTTPPSPMVSIIVPAYNVASTIDACLHSLKNQFFDQGHEIIVIDNGSNDDTVERVKGAGVKCILSPDTTVYGSRNLAVSAASGAILAFMDSDCQADPHWLAQGLNSLKKYDMVAGEVQPHPSKHHLLYCYDKYIANGDKRERNTTINIDTCNAIISKKVFEQVGGFDETVRTAGDSIFSMKARQLGFTVGYSSSAIVYHPVDGMLRRLRRAMREGHGSALKTPYLYGETTLLYRISRRFFNAWKIAGVQITSIKRARNSGHINCQMAGQLVGLAFFFQIINYTATLTARIAKPVNNILEIR